MQWPGFIFLVVVLLFAIPALLGFSMKAFKIWRGGLRDIGITFAVCWISLVLGTIAMMVLLSLGDKWPTLEVALRSDASRTGIICFIAFTVIYFALRKRGNAAKVSLCFIAAIIGVTLALDKVGSEFGYDASVGKIESIEDDGTLIIRMQDGTIDRRRPAGVDENGRVLYESIGNQSNQ